jgi:G protein-coupled receptor Mth (Methuselah protein)
MTMALYKVVLLMLATNIDSIVSKSCDLLDTVRINGDYYTMDNDDLLHNGVTYNSDQWTYFNKDWLVNGSQVDAQKHVRGCLCKVRDCIRLCCPLGHVGMDGVCVPFNGTYQLPFEVTDDTGNTDVVDLVQNPVFNQRFIVSRPCTTMFMLTPEDYEIDEFTFHTVSLSNQEYNITQQLTFSHSL